VTLNKQIALEKEMASLGAKRFQEETRKAKKGSHEATTPAGVQMLKQGVHRVAEYLDTVKHLFRKSQPMAYDSGAIEWLLVLDTDVLAFLGLKGCVNHLSTPAKLVTVANEIGGFIEDEYRFRNFRELNPALYDIIVRDLAKRTTNYRKQKRVLVHSHNKLPNNTWKPWSPNIKTRVGTLLCQIVCESTDIFSIDRITVSSQEMRTQYVLSATPKSIKWIEQKNSICELQSIVKLPCVVKPKDWTDIYTGGYYSYPYMHFIKSRDLEYKNQLNALGDQMSPVYEAVNIVQQTPWKINSQVFEVMNHYYENKLDCQAMPCEFEELTMTRPYPKEGTKEEIIEWKREATFLHASNIRRKTKRIQFAQLMWTAKRFKNEKEFYFPHTIDFRGRLYASTAFLNPQGEDSSRGLLEFAKKKPLGDSGLPWLAVHGANCYGYDKASLEDRVEWSQHNHKHIIECAKDPYSNKWWQDADKPWQFLRFCFEWAKAYSLKNPEEFMSSIPITVDGSCNGLQHFAGMLRDVEGGKSVNLLANDVPCDVYSIISQKAVEIMEKNNGYWEPEDVDRSIVKRPVMTTPYGATIYGMRDQIHEELKKQLDKGRVFKSPTIVQDVDLWPHCKFLAPVIYESIGQVLKSAREGMAWLQDVAKILAKENQAIYWSLPTGLLVKQRYSKFLVQTIKTVINGKIAYLEVGSNDPLDSLDKRRQSNGIAPNFVHSYDACHLMQTVRAAYNDYGISSFALVHDSFGTHASDMERLAQVIREEFIKIYSEDVLENFRSECQRLTGIKLPAPPKYGNLNIKEVKNSEYFFS
jgi:DNA-directed RNA polymerase